MRRIRRCLCLLPLLLVPALSRAGVQLVVDGVDDPLKAAVVAGVSLSQYAARDVSEAQVHRLYDYKVWGQGSIHPVSYAWSVLLYF